MLATPASPGTGRDAQSTRVVRNGGESWPWPERNLSAIEQMRLNCGVGEDSRVPWRSNQSILKETNSEYSLEGLKLKLQHFGHLKWGADSLGKTLKLGKIEGRRRRGHQRMRWLDGTAGSMDMSSSKLWRTRKPRGLQSTRLQSQMWLSDWTVKNRALGMEAPWEGVYADLSLRDSPPNACPTMQNGFSCPCPCWVLPTLGCYPLEALPYACLSLFTVN